MNNYSKNTLEIKNLSIKYKNSIAVDSFDLEIGNENGNFRNGNEIGYG